MIALLLGVLLGQSVPTRLPCTADTVLALHEGEEHLNGGDRNTLRLKGIENLILLDFDVAPLKGRRVDAARLFFVPLDGHKLKNIGLSTVGTPWAEGKGNGSPAKKGEATFLEAAHGERPWGDPGSDFHAVSFGAGGSIWASREMKAEADGWFSVELPPAFLHAMLEGNSFGLALSDDCGQTGHNNNVYSREQNAKAPYVLVSKSETATPPPSGARRFVPTAPQAAAPVLSPRIDAVPPPAPAIADGVRWKVLHEGEANLEAPPAARLWNGRTVALEAARGEHVGFCISVETPEPRAIRLEGPGWTTTRVRAVGDSYDPLVPIEGEVSGKALFHVERYVPKDAKPGETAFPLTLRTGKSDVALPVAIRVHSAVLPDALGFHVSLNTYGSPGDEAKDKAGSAAFLDLERSYYRLGHEHRGTLAVVPYSHRGYLQWNVAPDVKRAGAKVELGSWDAYDARWTPYFDGSAFKDLPRGAVPLAHFYWPMHEQWPLPINEFYGYQGKADDHWRDAPEPEKAFAPDYGRAFQDSVKAFGEHASSKGWSRTQFHVFLNNKPDIRFTRKENVGAWWRLDEPVSREDHLALRYFAVRSKEATRGLKDVLISFRADLSRPHWRRDYLDGVLDLDVVAGSYRRYPDFVFGRGEEVWIYGGVPAPGANGQSARASVLQCFLDGADGYVPWLTTGTRESWEKPTDTAVLLPPLPGMEKRAYATLRLKGLRRGQQDVELLRLLLAKRKAPRESLRPLVEALGLRPEFRKADEVDAGSFDYGKLDPERFEAVKRAVLAELGK